MKGTKRIKKSDEKTSLGEGANIIKITMDNDLNLLQLYKIKQQVESRMLDLLNGPPDVNTVLYDIERKDIAIFLQAVDTSLHESIMHISGMIEYEFKRVDGYIDIKTVKPIPIEEQPAWVKLLKLKNEDLPSPKSSENIFNSCLNRGTCYAYIYFKRRFNILPNTKFNYLDLLGEHRKGIYRHERDFSSREKNADADLFIISKTVFSDIYFLGYE
jgi:hypothetical protein